MEPGRVRRHVTVRGLVQNVWFRDSCREEALRRGVSGWVRNCADGTVEAILEGSPDQVEAMIGWCRRGPPRARVEGVEVGAEPVRDEVGFSIL